MSWNNSSLDFSLVTNMLGDDCWEQSQWDVSRRELKPQEQRCGWKIMAVVSSVGGLVSWWQLEDAGSRSHKSCSDSNYICSNDSPGRIEELHWKSAKNKSRLLKETQEKSSILVKLRKWCVCLCVLVLFGFTAKVCTNLSWHPVLKRCAHKDSVHGYEV